MSTFTETFTSRHLSIYLTLLSLSLVLCILTFLTVDVDATEYFNGREFDPSIQLSYSSPLTIPTNITHRTKISNAPEMIRWTNANFGGNIISPTGASWETGRIVVSHPIQACEPLKHPTNLNATEEQIKQYYQGKIVLTFRGGCIASAKAGFCERLGVLLHIMIMQEEDPERYAFNGVSKTDALEIPTGTINWDVGYTLVHSMLANPDVVVTATVPATGAASEGDITALKTIIRYYNQISPLEPQTYPGSYFQGTYDWTLFLNDSTSFDPCLQRLQSSTCQGGRIIRLEWDSMGLIGDFHPAFGQLTELEFFALSYNTQLIGPMPCEWGALHQLRVLWMGQTGLTSLTDCLSGWTSMEMLLAGFNSINNLPSALSSLHNIRIISLDSAKISAPMIDIRNWTKLEFLDFNANNITGSFPDLSHSRHTLRKFLISDNELSGILPVSAFDNMPKLVEVDIGRNNLSGVLPNFNNSNQLRDLGFDHNLFQSGIPVTWLMPYLTSLRGSHNQLSGLLMPLSRFASMVSIDLSWNHLTLPSYHPTLGSSLADWKLDVISYLAQCLPNPIQIIQLSHNQFNGTWKNRFVYQNNITHIYMSHNHLTALDPDTTFNLGGYASIATLEFYDLSHNTQLTGSLALVGPTPVLQVLKLNGCPLLRDIHNKSPALPQYITTSQDQITKNSADERYSCPALTGRNYPLQVSLDPSYYGYTGCICDQGTYGIPPDCLTIPIQANTTADPITVSGSITDNVYGSSRMSIGIDTAWGIGNIGVLEKNATLENGTVTNTTTQANTTQVIDQTESINFGSSIDRTVAIYITIKLLPLFNEYADIIDIYAGDTVNTVPLISVRGNYPRPIPSNYPDVARRRYLTNDTNIVTFVVFASHATLNFRSRATQGEHFTANYTLSASCPAGWYYDTTITKQCQLIPAILPIYEISSSIATAVWIIAAVAFTCIMATIIFVIYHHNTVIFKAASVPFCLTMLIAAALMTVGSIFYPLSPERGDYVCDVRIWFSTLSLVMLLAALLTKANRIREIFNNDDLNKPVQTNFHLMRTVAIIVIMEIVLLIALTSSDMTHPQLTLGSKATDGYRVYSCTSVEGDSYKVWLAFHLTFIGVFLFSGTYIAFGIRNVPSAFNESASIVNALYILALLSIILLPINFIVDDNVNALALIRGVGQSLIAFSMTLALFGSKYYYILDGRGNDNSMVQTPLSAGVAKRERANVTPDSGHVEIRQGGAAPHLHRQSTSIRSDQLLRKYQQKLSQIQDIIQRGGTYQEIQRVMTGAGAGAGVGSVMKKQGSSNSSKDFHTSSSDLSRANSFASVDDIEVDNPPLPHDPSSPSIRSTNNAPCSAVLAHLTATPSHRSSIATAPLQVGPRDTSSIMLTNIPQL